MADRKIRLAVLDDDPEIAEIVGQLGEEVGFASTVTTEADRLFAAMAENPPDAIVLDLQMPQNDGIQVLRRLADERNPAGILIMSGMDERTILASKQYAESKGLRVVGHLQKPVMPDELKDTLALLRSATGPLTVEDLESAVRLHQLAVHYQPTVKRFADGTWDIASVEALLRWDHPGRGVIAPEAFLGMSEESGIIGQMTDYVIQTALAELKVWHSRRLNLGLRVNIAANLITDIDFPDRLESQLRQHEIDPSYLTLEVTETAMLDRQSDTYDILTRLRVKQISLAMDDFGIGYSSLTQLFRMPFNEMKIDRSLVLDVPTSREASIMVDALVGLAHRLDLSVCAEGVETEEILEFLSATGCDSAQGFLIGRPVPARDVPTACARWDGREALARASLPE